MINKASNITNGWVEAPRPTQPMPDAPAVLGVYLAPGEDVEWLWTHTDEGSYVSGYNIIEKTESNIDNLVQQIGELAKETQKLAIQAVKQYSDEVEDIFKKQSRDSKRIERCLDGMLDFCFDHGMLSLYKKLCRYYYDIDPEATISYINSYREIWDEQE